MLRTDLECIIEGCSDRQHSKGWCQKHYLRHWKHGDVHHERQKTYLPKVPCTVDGCTNTQVRLKLDKYCDKHYYRHRVNGSADIAKAPWSSLGTPEERFWSKVDKLDEDSCWNWTGNIEGKKGRGGYGKFSVKNKSFRAHRFSYELATGTKLTSKVPVHHTCGNKLCVNPQHLQATTPHENTAEMLERNWYLKRIAELETQLAECACQVNT